MSVHVNEKIKQTKKCEHKTHEKIGKVITNACTFHKLFRSINLLVALKM